MILRVPAFGFAKLGTRIVLAILASRGCKSKAGLVSVCLSIHAGGMSLGLAVFRLQDDLTGRIRKGFASSADV